LFVHLACCLSMFLTLAILLTRRFSLFPYTTLFRSSRSWRGPRSRRCSRRRWPPCPCPAEDAPDEDLPDPAGGAGRAAGPAAGRDLADLVDASDLLRAVGAGGAHRRPARAEPGDDHGAS